MIPTVPIKCPEDQFRRRTTRTQQRRNNEAAERQTATILQGYTTAIYVALP